jgi:hypothetical protein
MMGILLPGSEDFLIEAILPWLAGRSTGIECFYKNTPEHNKLARNIKSAPAAWFFGYLSEKYTMNCVQRLVSCFEPEEAALVTLSRFDAETLQVTSEFAARPDFADMMIADGYGFPELGENEIVKDGLILESDIARELLHKNLKATENLSFGSKGSGASRLTGYDNANSVGASTHRTTTSVDIQLQHKERGLENVRVTSKNNQLSSQLNDSKKREEALLLRLQAFELKSTMKQSNGSPPDSGGPSTGSDAPSQQNSAQGDVSMGGG